MLNPGYGPQVQYFYVKELLFDIHFDKSIYNTEYYTIKAFQERLGFLNQGTVLSIS